MSKDDVLQILATRLVRAGCSDANQEAATAAWQEHADEEGRTA